VGDRRGTADGLERPGDEIGPYKLISALGEGGFGTVWLAERRKPFTQRVALKIIKPGMDSKAVIARFDQERQALAVMSHPAPPSRWLARRRVPSSANAAGASPSAGSSLA
jgi:serine/threonine protein kinase